MTTDPISQAIQSAGSVSALAAMAGVKPQAISQWRVRLPAERVLLIEKLTGVSRHDLRPDVFGPHSHQAASTSTGAAA